MLTANVAAQQLQGSFECESHTVAIDRLPGARFVTTQEPHHTGAQKLLESDFSDFGPRYPIQSVHFFVSFIAEPAPNLSVTQGKMHVFARLRTGGAEQWFQVADGDAQSGEPRDWYYKSSVADLLHVWFEPADKNESDSSDDPLVTQSGRPQVHIQQVESHEPVFLLKFIRLASAGGHGDVETEQAIVLDFRAQPFQAPAAVGCVKNDFGSEEHEDEWINCTWRHSQQDFVCKTNSYYAHDWSFLLIEGKKFSSQSVPH